MSKGRSLRRFMKEHKEIHKIAKVIAIFYGVFYYMSIGMLSFEGVKVYKQSFSDTFLESFLELRAPFVFESFAYFEIPPMIMLQVSPFNLVIMLVLIYLVYVNVVIIVIGQRYPRVCQIHRVKGHFLVMLPVLITGFICMVLVLVSLLDGANSNSLASLITLLYWSVPAMFLLLVYGIVQGYRSLHLHY